MNDTSTSKSKEYIDSHMVYPILRCNRCGHIIIKSDSKNYPYQCLNCDEDMYSIETHTVAGDRIDSTEYSRLIMDAEVLFGFDKQ